MKISISKAIKLLFRNRYTREGMKANKDIVNLEWYKDDVNLGDYLSTVIYKYMLSRHSIDESAKSSGKKTKHLMAVGSILGGSGDFDATVWGSGIRNFSSVRGLCRKKIYQKLDVRAVRGPFTRDALLQCGIKCPKVYGDPAVLMPLIYKPEVKEKSGTVLILHFLTPPSQYTEREDVTLLNIQTEDYKSFIDAIASADKVISSSLHGIILAEAYGIPAVFLRKGIESETIKFFDWYYSTGRNNIVVCSDLEEAMSVKPMPLPELAEIRTKLIEAFPYDLWEKAN